MTKKLWVSALAMVMMIFLLGACAPQEQPQQVIIDYLNARILGEAGIMRRLVCAGWESQVELEASAFAGRPARLDGVSCRVINQTDTTGTVACDGQIIATYDGEDNVFAIGNYSIVREDGAWKMCGEAQ